MPDQSRTSRRPRCSKSRSTWSRYSNWSVTHCKTLILFTFGFSFQSEKDQIMTATVWLELVSVIYVQSISNSDAMRCVCVENWKDEFLRWDEKAWGIKRIRLPGNKIWNPDLTLYNKYLFHNTLFPFFSFNYFLAIFKLKTILDMTRLGVNFDKH